MERMIQDVENIKEFNISIQRITNKNLEDVTQVQKDVKYSSMLYL